MCDRERLKRRYREGHGLVLAALRRWDPLGLVDESPDEYDGYAPAIVGLLDRGATTDDIARYLNDVIRARMGLPPNPAQDHKVAEELVNLWKRQKHTKRQD
ncbi:MAG: hypothetical protein JXO22_13780 [Phycisphaerae bacterium]|nr:hypothetical protein [Phycisphaerae bacterium]